VESDDEASDAEQKPKAAVMKFPSDDEHHSSDDEDDILQMKRSNHDLDEQEEDEQVVARKTKKPVTKAALAKKLAKKSIVANKKVTYDEDGNPVLDTAKQLQSELAQDYSDDDDEGGINIEKAKRLLAAEDKYDKERFRDLIREKHKEKKRKLKAKEAEEEDQQHDDFGSDEDDAGPDLSWLPDPDKLYGEDHNEDLDAMVASGSESDDSDFELDPPEDSDFEEEEAIHKLPTALFEKKSKKRPRGDEETVTPNRAKSKKAKKNIVEDLTLQDAESLAMALLK
jgi:ATP-dependent RNA helicase DDX10/DBP4